MTAATCSRTSCHHRVAVVLRNGEALCKKHGDKVPPYLRRPAKKGTTP